MMEKRLLKQNTASQKGKTLSDEQLAKIPTKKELFEVFLKDTEIGTVYPAKIPGRGSPHLLTISPVNAGSQSLADEDFEKLSIEILDACFSGQFCNTTTLHSIFERLVQAYQAYLLYLANQILENWHAAEDVVQETWARTFASLKRRCELGEQVDISHLRGFLVTVVRNTAYTYNSREHHFHFVSLEIPNGEKTGELEAIESDKFEQPEFHFIRNESRIALGTLLHCLPVSYRMVIVLRFYHDHSYEETAKILKCPIGTVKCYQNRGLRLLRQAVQNRGMISEDFDVWSDYSRRDSWLWCHMMRYKDAQNIA